MKGGCVGLDTGSLVDPYFVLETRTGSGYTCTGEEGGYLDCVPDQGLDLGTQYPVRQVFGREFSFGTW